MPQFESSDRNERTIGFPNLQNPITGRIPQHQNLRSFDKVIESESIHRDYDSKAKDILTKTCMCVPLMNAEGIVMAIMKLTNRFPSNIAPFRPLDYSNSVGQSPLTRETSQSSVGIPRASTLDGSSTLEVLRQCIK